MLGWRCSSTNLIVSRYFSTLLPRTLKIGDILSEKRMFSNEDVFVYSNASRDFNPLHFNSESARKAGFEDRLVHGMLVSSLFPQIISSQFPGAVYVSQSLHFRSPVYVGEEILAEVQATAIRETKEKYIAKFSTKCFKDNRVLVLDGEATAILPNLHLAQTHYKG